MVKNMKKSMQKIGLSGLLGSKKNVEIIDLIIKILEKENREIYLEGKLAKYSSQFSKYSCSSKKIITNCDLLISVGGDGTMINNAKKFGIEGIPILGVNLGSLGFLTDIAPEDLESSLCNILKGKFNLDKRFFLETKLNSEILNHRSLNEVVMHSGAIARMIEFDVYVENNLVYKQRADGLIVFTSTGSTAYSLSGGGPLIHPDLDIIGIMPMFPHSLNTTPILIDDNKTIRIILTKINGKQKSELSFDGQNNMPVQEGSEISIHKSEKQVTLVHPLNNDYFFGCRSKLGWGKSIVN